MSTIIDAPIENLPLSPPLTVFELWILTLGSILQKVCFQTEAHSSTNKEQRDSHKVADQDTALEVARPVSDVKWCPQAIYTSAQEEVQTNNSRLHMTCSPPRLIFDSFLLALKLTAAHQQPAFPPHPYQHQIEIIDKSHASRTKLLVSRGTYLVATHSFRRIKMLLSERCHLDTAKEANAKWAIWERRLQRHLIEAAIRTMKSRKARSLLQRISKEKFLKRLPSLILMLANSRHSTA